ncbi:TIGR04282 family arsenosugar biosynthesis glycosyltransferase [Nocardia spumae]|uniref:TIGR04282 family arsenosugar biosynthesis glycosyltransferase n=1 Tax=Nocardia spumae TaxID=2887190 RepID=UPI001D140CB3|nr:DUF2064 domain-containing protein [Nocardia spumae]
MTTLPFTLLVVAKAPVAGFAKTRLTPPLSPGEAADLAAASLLDTLAAVRASSAARAVVAWTGELDRAQRRREIDAALRDFDIVAQRGADFGIRLANAHADAARAGFPVLQIGMDTPQADSVLLTECGKRLLSEGDSVLGPAADGGWWALGLSDPRHARVLAEVPMSTDRTGQMTREALSRIGCHIALLPELDDVDRYDDIAGVAAGCQGLFATAAARLISAAAGHHR